MSTTAEKLTYLSGTKDRLKTTINYAGAGLTNETFRQYPEKLYDKYLDILKDNGEELFNGLPKDLGSGTSISMNNTANTRMKMSLTPSELEQATTTGKNLAQLTLSEEGTAGGIIYKPNEDGSITITGTRTSGSTKKAFSVYLEPSTRYYFNCFDRNTGEKYENSQLQGVVSDFIVTINDNFRTTSSFVAGTYDLALKGSTNGASFNGTYFFSLAKEDLTTYEPYTGGIASPNPDYPQDIHTISGDNTIKIANANNVFNAKSYAENSTSYFTYSEEQGLTITQYDGRGFTSTGIYFDVEPSTKYYLKLTNDIRTTVGEYNSGGGYVNATNLYNGDNFTTNSTTRRIYIKFGLLSTPYPYNIGLVAITKNADYQEQNLPLTLGTLEYCKIGDYADEFYLATASDTGLTAGKWYLKKNIGKKILDGSETWSGTTSYYTGVFISTIDTNTIGERVVGYSNYFTVNGYNYSVPNNLYFHPNKNCHISNQNNVYYASLDAWKTWLSNHHTTVYYRLATPEYTLLNDTLQVELNNIKKALSYDTQTNISQVNNDLPFVISANVVQKYFLNDEPE